MDRLRHLLLQQNTIRKFTIINAITIIIIITGTFFFSPSLLSFLDLLLLLLLLLLLPSSHMWSDIPTKGAVTKVLCIMACDFLCLSSPAGSPSRGGDVVVYVFDMNQPSLPRSFFFLFLCLFLSLWPFRLYFIP